LSCTEYAAVAAQFARLIRPYDAVKADRYLESARHAFAWAQAHPESGTTKSGRDLFLAWAAAELYSTTGEEVFNQTFQRLCQAGAMKEIDWKLSQVAPICQWSYIVCKQAGVDLAIQQELKSLALQRADAIVRDTETPAYRVGRGAAERGNGWGNLNGGGRWADPCLRAYFLTRDRKYLDTACLSADFQLGANPLSRTFLTGLGARFPEHPEISEFLYTRPHRTGSTVKGITIYGLTSDEPQWYPAIPSWRRWRDLGNGGAEVSSEFTITETIGGSAMLYSVLYALELSRR
jgi:endoglucanase